MPSTLRDAIEQILAADVSDLSDAAVRAEFCEITACAELLELARCRLSAAVEGRGLPNADGAASTATWIQLETGRSRRKAQHDVRLGRALHDFPRVEAAWSSGTITSCAAAVIIDGRSPGAEAEYARIQDELVRFAQHRSYRSLRRAIAYYRHCCRGHETPCEPEGLFLSRVGDEYVLNGTLDVATGEFVAKAIDAALMPPAADDVRTAAQRRAQALGLIAKTFCDVGAGQQEHTASPHIGVLLDWATLTDAAPLATVGSEGMPITREVLDRLLCESTITRIITGPQGEVLDVGRSRRTPSRAQRQAVIARDHHCRFPGCDRPAGWSEIHHVHPWQHGGPTDLHNLVLLCSHHHHVVHRPGWVVKFDGAELTVISPEGRERTTRPPGPPLDTG